MNLELPPPSNCLLALTALVGMAGAGSCDATPATPPRGSHSTPVQAPAAPAQLDDSHMSAAFDASPSPEPAPSEAAPLPDNHKSDPNTFVDLVELMPQLRLDMRYAGTNNFVGKVIYPKSRCLLRAEVAQALVTAQQALKKKNLQLLVWDCYRPFSVQEQFWKMVPDPRYVAQPTRKKGKAFKGSKHNRGAAVDLSVLGLDGKPVPVPTDHDDFSVKAHVNAPGTPKAASDNASKLRTAMEEAGFTGIATEWWHFDHKSWQQFALSDQPL